MAPPAALLALLGLVAAGSTARAAGLSWLVVVSLGLASCVL